MNAQSGMRLNRKAPPELLIGQRLGQPRTVDVLKWLKAEHGTRLIYEIDDDLFHVPRKNPAARIYHPAILKGMVDCMGLVDHITTSTPELASRVLEQVGRNLPVTVLENCLPGSAFRLPGHQNDGPVMIGWRGSATHQEDFAEVRHGLNRILDRADVRLKLIGSAPVNGLPAGKIDTVSWIPDIHAFYEELNFDIGIVPLADNVFNDSKSHIAVLEMAARGIPAIASDMPSYRRFIQHGTNGFLVRQKHEWAKYMKILIEDPEMRMNMGKEAFVTALRFRAGGSVTQAYRDVYRHVLGGTR